MPNPSLSKIKKLLYEVRVQEEALATKDAALGWVVEILTDDFDNCASEGWSCLSCSACCFACRAR